MAEIVWTREAARWLEEIYEYIAADSPNSAHKVVSGIYEKVQLLREHPRLGQRYEPIRDREVREILYGHYRIAYLVKSDSRIEIRRRDGGHVQGSSVQHAKYADSVQNCRKGNGGKAGLRR